MSATAISSSVAFWPGIFLALGGIAKLAEVRTGIDQNSLTAMTKPGPLPLAAWIGGLAVAELLVGVLVLAGVATPTPEWLAAALMAGATATAVWGIWKVPNADCGCFGPRSGRVSWKTIARAGGLCGLAVIAALGGAAWTAGFDELIALPINIAIGIGLLALSPEFTLDSLRDLFGGGEDDEGDRPRTVSEALCFGRLVPIHRHIARLQDSEQYHLVESQITNTRPSEFWQDGCWRYICFESDYEGQKATAVFALHLGINRFSRTVIFVDMLDQRVLGKAEVEHRGPDPLRLVTRKGAHVGNA